MSTQLRILFLLIASVLISTFAKAELVALPESHHLQYETYGLYFDEESNLLWRDGGRAWGALGGSIALLGDDSLPYQPQLIVHGTANAAYQVSTSELLTQTIDARVGLALDLRFDDTLRGMIMWTHQSGHVSDNVPDMSLFGSNLGNEVLDFRVIKDIQQQWRVGVSFRPTVGSDPGMCVLGGEQFAEYWPWGEGADAHHFKPYIAAGLEEWGRGTIQLTENIQIGYAAGSHFRPDKHSSMRVVAGYYYGNDPRMKYYQFFYNRLGFAYAGFMFDI